MRRDLVTALFGVFFLAGAGLLWWEGSRQSFIILGAGIAYDPLFFPRVLLGIGGICAAGIVILGLTTRDATDAGQRWGLWLALVALIAAYFWTMTEVGFLSGTVLFIVLFCLLLGYRRWKILLPAAVGIAATVWYTFTAWLQVPLPLSAWLERLFG